MQRSWGPAPRSADFDSFVPGTTPRRGETMVRSSRLDRSQISGRPLATLSCSRQRSFQTRRLAQIIDHSLFESHSGGPGVLLLFSARFNYPARHPFCPRASLVVAESSRGNFDVATQGTLSRGGLFSAFGKLTARGDFERGLAETWMFPSLCLGHLTFYSDSRNWRLG